MGEKLQIRLYHFLNQFTKGGAMAHPRSFMTKAEFSNKVFMSAGRKQLRIDHNIIMIGEGHMGKATPANSRTECRSPVAIT